ncbi:hypothetical protein RJ639_023516 [Escallonia herrerae]|uniref:Uncharacterized protein n=1 Tax=Escallonia herrerae TaxID=1293975 RepID=A0AA88V1T9_9ASTE|nr:hypothetical protein RJ639_023516 [Escallonia herrerae]
MILIHSLAFNLLLLYILFVGCKEWELLSWSRRAAAEAEAVASVSCSGHGRAYLDGIPVDGMPVCECNSCFGGPNCSEVIAGCPADVDRMSYSFNDNSSISQELEKLIRKVHAIAKNAVTGRFIVFGAGSTQLLNAAVHALSMDNPSPPSAVVASVPFYPVVVLSNFKH